MCLESLNSGATLDFSEVESCAVAMADDHAVRVFRQLPKAQRRAANLMYRSIARGVTEENMSRVRAQLLRAVRIASKMPQAKRLQYIRRQLSALRLYGEDSGAISTVVRTQTSIADSISSWLEAWADPDVWGFEYVARPDARPEHRALHGTRYPKSHKFWRKYFPPNGWNCRCRARIIRYRSTLARIKPFVGTPDVDPGFRFNPGIAVSRVY